MQTAVRAVMAGSLCTLVFLAGCTGGDSPPSTFNVFVYMDGAYTEEQHRDDFAALVEEHDATSKVFYSVPPQYLIEDLDGPGCESFRAAAEGKHYVADVGECSPYRPADG